MVDDLDTDEDTENNAENKAEAAAPAVDVGANEADNVDAAE